MAQLSPAERAWQHAMQKYAPVRSYSSDIRGNSVYMEDAPLDWYFSGTSLNDESEVFNDLSRDVKNFVLRTHPYVYHKGRNDEVVLTPKLLVPQGIVARGRQYLDQDKSSSIYYLISPVVPTLQMLTNDVQWHTEEAISVVLPKTLSSIVRLWMIAILGGQSWDDFHKACGRLTSHRVYLNPRCKWQFTYDDNVMIVDTGNGPQPIGNSLYYFINLVRH